MRHVKLCLGRPSTAGRPIMNNLVQKQIKFADKERQWKQMYEK